MRWPHGTSGLLFAAGLSLGFFAALSRTGRGGGGGGVHLTTPPHRRPLLVPSRRFRLFALSAAYDVASGNATFVLLAPLSPELRVEPVLSLASRLKETFSFPPRTAQSRSSNARRGTRGAGCGA